MLQLLVTVALLAFSVEFASAQHLFSQAEFNNAVSWNGYPVPGGNVYDALVSEIWRSNINSKQEAAMAVTQFMHESDGYRALREYRCQNDGCPNEYNSPGCDVGGQRYYGRGWIQLTWCTNYRDASIALYGNDWLIYDTDAVARDVYIAWQTSMWYWASRVHNAPGVQDGRFGASTRAINGDLECDGDFQHVARKRFEMYNIVRSAFNLGGNGDERGCYN